MVTDSFVIYVKAHPDGRLLSARYEVHDRDSYAIIEGAEMSRAWLDHTSLEGAIARLREAAITATLNVPDEKQLEMEFEGF